MYINKEKEKYLNLSNKLMEECLSVSNRWEKVSILNSRNG